MPNAEAWVTHSPLENLERLVVRPPAVVADTPDILNEVTPADPDTESAYRAYTPPASTEMCCEYVGAQIRMPAVLNPTARLRDFRIFPSASVLFDREPFPAQHPEHRVGDRLDLLFHCLRPTEPVNLHLPLCGA